MQLRVMPEMQQHLQPVRLGEGRNVGVEVRITPREFLKSGQKLLVEHQAVATGMGGDDGDAFVERQAEPLGVSHRLVFPDQAELIADVAEKRKFPSGQCPIKRNVFGVGRVEVLGVGQDFDQDGPGVGAAMDFIYRVFALRIDRRAGQKNIGMGLHGAEDVVIADEKVCMLAIEQAGLIVEPVHAKQHRLRDMLGGA